MMHSEIKSKKAVELIKVSKIYSNGIVANKNINLDLKYGEIHAILGENGAGKSTLMKTLFGLHQPTSGVIKIDGEVMQITSPNIATDLGIGMVHQHFQLINNFSVLDNIILGYELKDKAKINQLNYFFSIYISYIDKIELAKIAKIKGDFFNYKKHKCEAKIFHKAKKIDFKVAKKIKKINDWHHKEQNKKLNAQQVKDLEHKYQELLEKFNLFNKTMAYKLEKLEYKLTDIIIALKNKYNNRVENNADTETIICSKINQLKKRMNFYRSFLHRMKRKWQTRFWLNSREANKRIEQICEKMNFKINLKEKVNNISIYDEQKVEILKVLYRDAKILILDEPTAVLTPQEIDDLMKMLLEFKSQGKAILIITHKLNEIKAIADRCTIIRQGEYIDTVNVKKTSVDKLAEKMVGRKISFSLKKKPLKLGEKLLVLKNINTLSKAKVNILKNFSLTINRGEILGIAGIEGNGQEDIVNIICRRLNPVSGEVMLFDELDVVNKVTNKLKQIKEKEAILKDSNIKVGQKIPWEYNLLRLDTKDTYNLGIHHIPADRQKQGLVLDMSLWENISLRDQFNRKYTNYGLLNLAKIKEKTQEIINNFDVRGAKSVQNRAKELSGGNQQKVIIGRELSESPKLIIAEQPTRGLDVGAIEYIYESLLKQRDQGNAVLLISYELDEVINLSDRIITINNGKNMGEVKANNVTKEKLGLMMVGVNFKDE